MNKHKWRNTDMGGETRVHMDDGFIDIDDLAKFLKLKKRTAYHIVATLNIPHYRVGRLIRFKLSEVEEWMNKNKAEQLDVPYGKIDNI